MADMKKKHRWYIGRPSVCKDCGMMSRYVESQSNGRLTWRKEFSTDDGATWVESAKTPNCWVPA